MKQQTLKMSLEEAIKYYNNSLDLGFKELLESTFGKNFAKPKMITDLVYNISSLESYLNTNTQVGFCIPFNLDTRNKFERYLNACYILAKVAEVYNEKTVINWNNINEYKYIPYKYFSCGGYSVDFHYWNVSCSVSGLLYYKSQELAKISYNNFKQYWEDYWQI